MFGSFTEPFNCNWPMSGTYYTFTLLYLKKYQPATTGGYAKYSAPRMRHSKSILANRCASLTYIRYITLIVLLRVTD